jgi:hypothetical protein
MLQKLGLIKYYNNFTYINDYHLNPTNLQQYNNRYYFSNSNQNQTFGPKNIRSKSYDKRSKPLLNVSLNPKNELKVPKVNKDFMNNINRFLSGTVQNVEINYSPNNLVRINHDIDDSSFDSNKFMSLSSTKSRSDFNRTNFSQKNKLINNYRLKYINDYIENQKNNFKVEEEIKNKKNLIKKLNIINDSIANKINLIKNEYNNFLGDDVENGKNFTNDLLKAQTEKINKKVIDNDILALKGNIMELKNKISIMNREQHSLNLLLFKEKLECDLKKEDVNKMSKLNEDINEDIKELKNEIFLIRDKNNKLKKENNKLSLYNSRNEISKS